MLCLRARSVSPDMISSPALKAASNTCAVAVVSVTRIFGARPAGTAGARM